ncbi:hypothetical protein [Rarobacter incanus]|uniref:HTH luxR-type domain-containing protein n=1 Tax=Rarobacter incanus TaxID=153494 RepID=A0A542SPS9_9MICO|nr:hypothetical protein [Rarobacter incanus]TQK76578.1 hypothetical protein FB389_1262 [Rarobacter incanus]
MSEISPEELLRIALRSRARDAEKLALIAGLEQAATDSRLAELSDAELLKVHDDGGIEYFNPFEVAVTQIAQGVASANRFLDRLRASLEDLPEFLRSWQEGSQPNLLGRVIHGPAAVEQIWRENFTTRAPRDVRVVLVGPSTLQQFGAVQPEWAHQYLTHHDVRIRCVVDAITFEDGPNRSGFDDWFPPWVSLRVNSQATEMLHIYDDLLLVQAETSMARFDSVIAIQGGPIASLAAAHFESLWRSGGNPRPPAAVRPWEALIELLAQGLTIESAARTLLISERTARRRIAEAMDYYGASSLFELGRRSGKA